jgi:hypothetical protein
LKYEYANTVIKYRQFSTKTYYQNDNKCNEEKEISLFDKISKTENLDKVGIITPKLDNWNPRIPKNLQPINQLPLPSGLT